MKYAPKLYITVKGPLGEAHFWASGLSSPGYLLEQYGLAKEAWSLQYGTSVLEPDRALADQGVRTEAILEVKEH